MKAFVSLFFALTSLSLWAQNKPMTSTYKVDPSQSKISWLGKKVSGQHNGKISIKSGSLSFVGEEISAGEIIVDMNSLICEDIPGAEDNAKFVGHMKSADFFDAAKYPDSKLVIKSSKKTPKGLEVIGDLTMKGKTQPVTFLAIVKQSEKFIMAKTELKLDRTKWDLKYGSGQFFKGLGDKMIYDDFTLTIDLTAKM